MGSALGSWLEPSRSPELSPSLLHLPSLPFSPRILPPPQDAAGPPGPLRDSPAARLRLPGAPVREHPRRAGPPDPSCVVGALRGSPQARAARPCPTAPLRTHPSQDQRASGGVSADAVQRSLWGWPGELLFPPLLGSAASVLLTGWVE
jgi:hypothetical protein